MSTITATPTLHRRALTQVGDLLAAVSPADLARPTPCAGWDLAQLLAHMIGQNHGFADAAESDVGIEAFADRPVRDPAAQWAASATRVGDALAAAVADGRTVLLAEFAAFGRIPAPTLLGMHLLDTVVHGWDVATALDRPHRPDDELVAATLEIARTIPGGPTRTGPDATFGPIVPGEPDDPWELALHLVGRRPRPAGGAD
ncbi:TIGR03086 family metal-binding protein [Pseudonocardia humida]|uniref:TIGR03086 family protein n=1 Tax=Pseudonocardia humida TaxID=2800819 RepID=A0ABT1A6T1_9PSEU|nr:TIGR03086 family metal-binding protein [Pseudonocardia humida]MCO1658742.1 TIGR03086 family protein [Pseudonocardia humida]